MIGLRQTLELKDTPGRMRLMVTLEQLHLQLQTRIQQERNSHLQTCLLPVTKLFYTKFHILINGYSFILSLLIQLINFELL